MDYNLHTHTFRCGHAQGRDEEYVTCAIEKGLKTLGFSDHIPLKFEDGKESSFRVQTNDIEDYFSSLNKLKEKYKDKIDIYIGFETEYYPKYFEKMLSTAINFGAEYLILGPHFYMPENLEKAKHIYNKTDDLSLLEEYSVSVVDAMKTGKFTYVAHPDMFNYVGDKLSYQRTIKKICVASRELNIPLEINFLGVRDNRIYPKEWFWEVAGREKALVTFGCDAHSPDGVYNKQAIEKGSLLVEKYKLNYIGKPDIIFLK